jgi:hypothetical protein
LNQSSINETAFREQNVKTQMKWFKSQFDKISKKSEWNFILGHHPIYDAKDFGFELNQEILPYLKTNKIHAVFNGHQHCLRLLKDDYTIHVVSGAGGNDINKPNRHSSEIFVAAEPGFVYVKVKYNLMTIQMYSAEKNEILKSFEVSK